jgi:hypothetical protein
MFIGRINTDKMSTLSEVISRVNTISVEKPMPLYTEQEKHSYCLDGNAKDY